MSKDFQKRIKAMEYAYRELGSSPCEDCNNFRHITTQEERNDFIECVSNKTCKEAQEYNEKYDKLIEKYLNENEKNI